MALVTTFATTPLVQWLYPPWYQKKLEAWKRGEIDWDNNPLRPSTDTSTGGSGLGKMTESPVSKLLVYLRLESLPSLFTFISLLSGEKPVADRKVHPSKAVDPVAANETASRPKKPLEAHGLRLLPLTERTSSVMRVSSTTSQAIADPVVNAFRTFASLNDLAVSGGVSIVPETSFAAEITNKAEDFNTDLVIIPWAENNSIAEVESSLGGHSSANYTDAAQAAFVRQTLDDARCDVVVLVNAGFGGPASLPAVAEGKLKRTTSHISTLSLRDRHQDAISRTVGERSHHVFFPFIGGSDDRVALRLVLLLARNGSVTATILHVRGVAPASVSKPELVAEVGRATTTSKAPSTIEDVRQSEEDQDSAFLHSLRDSLPVDLAERVVFTEVSLQTGISSSLLSTVAEEAKKEVNMSPRNAGDLIVLGRHSYDAQGISGGIGGGEVATALGGMADGVLGAVRCSVLVVQAGGHGQRSRREAEDEIRYA